MKKYLQKDLLVDFSPRVKKGLSVKKLTSLMKKWQARLLMKDWKFDLKIVDFQKDNGYRQSGHFIADPKKKTATILLTWNPWRDEEKVLFHEMIHVMLWDFDKFNEKKFRELGASERLINDQYLSKLEELVDHLMKAFWAKHKKV